MSWSGGITSESLARAQRKYDDAHTTRVGLKLNIKTDADIIQKLRSQKSMQGYIKQLIREDINNGNG